eukprot:NODE_97_length_20652_cov_0.832093.p15 type:complete len:125 gc:universal NODE_97_length_20652_cov_0.832093:1624-1998(+)
MTADSKTSCINSRKSALFFSGLSMCLAILQAVLGFMSVVLIFPSIITLILVFLTLLLEIPSPSMKWLQIRLVKIMFYLLTAIIYLTPFMAIFFINYAVGVLNLIVCIFLLGSHFEKSGKSNSGV